MLRCTLDLVLRFTCNVQALSATDHIDGVDGELLAVASDNEDEATGPTVGLRKPDEINNLSLNIDTKINITDVITISDILTLLDHKTIINLVKGCRCHNWGGRRGYRS